MSSDALLLPTDCAIRISGIAKRYMIAQEKSVETTLLESMLSSVKSSWNQVTGGQSAKNQSLREFWALDDVSFDVPRGQKLGIMGRNGAGKSTLLKILSRVTEPTNGRVAIRGRVASLLEVGTGFNPDLSGRENIFLNGAILGMSQREIRRKFDEIVAFSEVEGFLDTPVKRYSSGMFVRLAFAVAANLDSEILIVDEVLAVGDAQFQKKCLGKMDAAALDGRTVIFVSHSSATVARLCSHAVLLDKGRLVAAGTSNEVIRQYLGGRTATETEFVLEPDDGKDLNLLMVEFNPGKKEGARAFYNEPLQFRLTYRVNRRAADCMIWLAVQTRDGQTVFCSADSDSDPEVLLSRQVGTYQTDLVFPAGWLSYGEYQIVVGLIRNSPVEVFHREEVLSFEVDEAGMPSAVTGIGHRAGLIQPTLPWRTVRLE
jgi:lipopolysaccharide transport system ATP-binding protein